jgi:hypothetical protein
MKSCFFEVIQASEKLYFVGQTGIQCWADSTIEIVIGFR